MIRLRPIASVATALSMLAGGCATCDEQGELLRRYDTKEYRGDGAGLVEVSVFATDPPATARTPLLLALHPTAQDEAIKAVVGLDSVKTGDDLLGVLGKPLPRGADDGVVIDKTRFSKRIVISALRPIDKQESPADRIDELAVKVTLTDATSHFVSWDRFSTQEEDVDLGKMSLKKGSQTELSLAGDAAAAGVPVQASVTQTFTREQLEEAAIGQRRVQLAGVLKPQEAQIYQQGIRGVDLSGTAQIDLLLAVDAFRTQHPVSEISGFRAEDGSWQKPEKLVVKERRVRVPRPGICEVAATVTADYRVRQATRAHRTYSEGDDAAVYRKGSVDAQPLVLIGKDDLHVNVWRLSDDRGYALSMAGVSGNGGGQLEFPSEEQAVAFLEWLTEADHTTVRGRRLYTWDAPAAKSRPYVPADAGRLAVSARAVHACP